MLATEEAAGSVNSTRNRNKNKKRGGEREREEREREERETEGVGEGGESGHVKTVAPPGRHISGPRRHRQQGTCPVGRFRKTARALTGVMQCRQKREASQA